MSNLTGIKFNSDGLVPAIAQDALTGRVLMLAYMNKIALDKTIKTGFVHYYSRSRKAIWQKGETSGNTQKLVAIKLDCDGDTLLVTVEQKGPACHTNAPTCFFNELKTNKDIADLGVLRDCISIIKERKASPKEKSYTNYLLDKGAEKVCKKIGEEASEVIIAALKKDKNELANESADLLYHLFVLLELNNLDLTDVLDILKQRRANS